MWQCLWYARWLTCGSCGLWQWLIDSAALVPWNVGKSPDARTVKCLHMHGLDTDHTARVVPATCTLSGCLSVCHRAYISGAVQHPKDVPFEFSQGNIRLWHYHPTAPEKWKKSEFGPEFGVHIEVKVGVMVKVSVKVKVTYCVLVVNIEELLGTHSYFPHEFT